MSGYRERQDPREIAFELLREAYARESQAMVDKSHAEMELSRAQAQREAAWQNLGARTNLVRHLRALQTSLAGARARAAQPADPDASRAVVERLEAERARFLKERGVDPGPALTEPRPEQSPSDLEQQLEVAQAGIDESEQQIRAADEQIASARAGLGRALEGLAEATRARVLAEAELRQLSG